jgi:hypothetical protein
MRPRKNKIIYSPPAVAQRAFAPNRSAIQAFPFCKAASLPTEFLRDPHVDKHQLARAPAVKHQIHSGLPKATRPDRRPPRTQTLCSNVQVIADNIG